MFPAADVPVLQLSINAELPFDYHFNLGAQLHALRSEGVLIVGSGNVVHNLRLIGWGGGAPYDWATRFNDYVRDALSTRQYQRLIDYEQAGADARLAVPTPEHYLPLLYVLGTQQPGDVVTFPTQGVDGGSISMLSVQVGGTK